MIGGIRPGGGPATQEGHFLARRLPELMARLRGPMIDDLAKRLCAASPTGMLPEPSPSDEESPTTVGSPGAVASQLADLLTSEGIRTLDARREAERAHTSFLKAVRRAPDALALKALLRHHLRTTQSGVALRRDLRALDRWLDADALVERMDKQIEDLGVELDPRGNVKTDTQKMTSVPGVFAAGDMARGQSLVVWAIAEGREAAHHIDTFLMGTTSLPRLSR